jgi:DNA repair protein RecO (recombination protein O)
VLRVRPLGEKDRVLELFGPEIGRWSAVARGARGPKSKTAALSQPFVLARMLLAKGRSLDVLTQGEIENAHFHIPTHLLGAAWASYWCELCAGLPERHAEDEVFALLQDALAALDHACAQTEAPEGTQRSTQTEAGDSTAGALALLGHWFEARFLALLGFPSVVGTCARCESKIAVEAGEGARVAFSPRLGGTLCASCAPDDPSRLEPHAHTLRLLHRLERTPTPALLPDAAGSSARWQPEVRTLLQRSLLAHLDLRPRSRRFLDDLAARTT